MTKTLTRAFRVSSPPMLQSCQESSGPCDPLSNTLWSCPWSCSGSGPSDEDDARSSSPASGWFATCLCLSGCSPTRVRCPMTTVHTADYRTNCFSNAFKEPVYSLSNDKFIRRRERLSVVRSRNNCREQNTLPKQQTLRTPREQCKKSEFFSCFPYPCLSVFTCG